MQTTTLKVRVSTGNVLSDSAEVMSCVLEELGCEAVRRLHWIPMTTYGILLTTVSKSQYGETRNKVIYH